MTHLADVLADGFAILAFLQRHDVSPYTLWLALNVMILYFIVNYVFAPLICSGPIREAP